MTYHRCFQSDRKKDVLSYIIPKSKQTNMTSESLMSNVLILVSKTKLLSHPIVLCIPRQGLLPLSDT